MAEVYEMQDWESWEVPGRGSSPSGLRITTDVELPFAAADLLTVSVGPEGLEFLEEHLQVKIILTPAPGPRLAELFEQCSRFFIPVILTEVDFPNNRQRTWLASPRRARA